MRNKAVFLDRDGTINVDKGYIYRISEFEYLPNAIDGLRLFQEAGFLLIIITNQSGIARGFYSQTEYETLTQWMIEDLKKKGIYIEACFMCPHLPDGFIEEYRMKCSCRKPETGLFFRAIQKYDIDLQRSIAVGDNERDLSICNDSACRGFIIDPNKKKKLANDRITRVSSLYDAAVVSLQCQDKKL